MTDVQIRRAVEHDQGIIRQMVRDARLDPSALDWSHFLMAESEGQVVGIGQIRPYPNCHELGSLIVKADYRKQGVGALLVNALLADEPGDVYLECAVHNEPYYERFGFRRIPWWQAPSPLKLKLAFVAVGRLFGLQIIAMKRIKPLDGA